MFNQLYLSPYQMIFTSTLWTVHMKGALEWVSDCEKLVGTTLYKLYIRFELLDRTGAQHSYSHVFVGYAQQSSIIQHAKPQHLYTFYESHGYRKGSQWLGSVKAS